ncbi:hypothetical protein GCM10017044_20220 [Kordiimonas sediminis]|uniref:Uncharacterized protein n=1 Tax=Kordiimonas sediminis TaxID=1735581 RepID=A0A919AUA7_9PROT|nr:hypothetical protein GCM10017044_20220 [Kordiimonas sediminis]
MYPQSDCPKKQVTDCSDNADDQSKAAACVKYRQAAENVENRSKYSNRDIKFFHHQGNGDRQYYAN